MANVTLVLGAQWGDEGKGKWVDILAKDVDVIVRFQGGDNAGHTLFIDGKKTVLHLIPSGIFHPSKACALAAGVVINPIKLQQEMNKLEGLADVSPNRFWLSARAHIITPWHVFQDEQQEAKRSIPIGTTKRGIGPTYMGKSARQGLRLGAYVDADKRQAWINGMQADPEFRQCWEERQEQWEQFVRAADGLKPFVTDTEHRVRQAIKQGQSLLLEGAQGSLLDIDHGTYPYVTSSSTIAGGAVASLGIAPKSINRVLGVSKAYVTRVGSGPFPTEIFTPEGQEIAKRGHEFGATTNRPRRCGWLDLVALRYAVAVNGCDGVILNKLDILSGFPTLKVCVAYQHPTLGRLTEFPWDIDILAECAPVYQDCQGWLQDISGIRDPRKLPAELHRYVETIASQIGCPVVMLGNGVDRQDALML